MENQNVIESGRRTRGVAFFGLLGWLLLTFLAAAFGAQFQPGVWYRELAKPEWTPPGWIFGPVWTFLYASMAVAAWLVWRDYGRKSTKIPLLLYAVQLLLNGLWSWLFFGRQSVVLALVDIIALVVLVGATTILFWRQNRLAGMLFVPYLLWVGFATVLNLQIWLMNR